MKFEMKFENALLNGDCLEELKKIPAESVDLIYLDPPFFSQCNHSLKNRDNSKEYSFEDKWENIESYRSFMENRLKLCYERLKPTGSIFLHCDKSASHHLRLSLDRVFGCDNFQSEIIWFYRRWSNARKGLLGAHQNILFYSKTENFKFHTFYADYSPTTNLDQIFQARIRNQFGKSAYKTDENGRSILLAEKKGVPLSDVWEIPYLNPKAKERVGYPTQKPIILLERIIQLVTDPGDLILDPFCGSGSTLVAAKLLKRNFIGIDISIEALRLANKRLISPVKTESLLLLKGKKAYLKKTVEMNEILKLLEAVPVQRNKGIDGFLKFNNSLKPIPVKIQARDETLEMSKNLLIEACRTNNYSPKILVAGVFGQSLDLASFHAVSQPENDLIIVTNINDFAKNRVKYLSAKL